MASMSKFKRLQEPGYIGSVRTRNRMMKNGAHLFYDTKADAGHMNDRNIAFYETLAKGGVGLIVATSGPLVDGDVPGFRIDRDEYIPGFRKLADAIHKHGCPAFIQLFHLGPMSPLFFKAPAGVAASSIPKSESPRPSFEVARELTIPEIQEIVERFGKATERIKKAGFEGIELNGATNHLLNSFLSLAWNKRQDAYGSGSLESRARIVVEIIQDIKRRNGQDFAIISLINGAEVGLKEGITSEESQGFAKILQQAGADAIEVRAEFYMRPEDDPFRDSTHFPEIYFYPEPPKVLGANIDGSHNGVGASVPLAAAIKKVVSVPVIVSGRLNPEIGEKAIRHGMVDFISLNRPLLADPELPNKILSGRLEDITPCTSCLTCFDFGEHAQPVHCQVNASLGREREYAIKATERRKRVMIVGGGPAGMEAARVAALRGHEVMLYAREHKLGGSLPLAAVVKGFEREDLLSLICYLGTQMTKLGVKINRGQEVNRSLIEEIKPDVLIVAAGGTHSVPDLSGMNKPNVMTSRDLHRKLKIYLRFFGPRVLRWLSKFWMPFGKRVVIMGGGIHGCQVAEFLVKRGRKVTIVDTAKEIGNGLLETLVKPHLLMWLSEKGVTMMTEVKYEEITDRGLTITTKEGKKQTIEADTIVTAMPLQPSTELFMKLEGSAPEIYAIGDCKEPNKIIDAIADGSRIARAI
jgi:2,4-dienoyl-CoA reductase (NADPH2)